MDYSKSLLTKFQEYLDVKAEEIQEKNELAVNSNIIISNIINSPFISGSEMSESSSSPISSAPKCLNVGIIGGGISGLYSALLLKEYVPDVKVKIFEATNKLGGRIYTHHFSSEPYQYFEAGAMRIPVVEGHKPVFDLIDYLNEHFPKNPIELIDFFYSCPSGNRVLINGARQRDGHVMSVEYANKYCSELGFPSSANIIDGNTASQLLGEAVAPVIDELITNFDSTMEKYKHVSMLSYLSKELGWNDSKMNFVEVMTFQTCFFQRGLLDVILFGCDISDAKAWKTIDGGMSKLIQSCSDLVMMNNGEVLLNANVESVIYVDNKVQVGYTDPKKPTLSNLTYKLFDAVIMAIPPHSIRTMLERPQWSPELEYALRTIKSQPIIKIGLVFNSRFWESPSLQHSPSYGGKSITDLPSTWIEYPSYGIGDSGKGVLHVYCYRENSENFLTKSKSDKIRLVLRDLQLLYPEVDIAREYAGGIDPHTDKFLKSSFVMDWSLESSIGLATCYPGQFCSLYPIMVQPQGNVYFAGCHLSPRNCWIAGAIGSAKRAVQQLVSKNYGCVKNIEYISNGINLLANGIHA